MALTYWLEGSRRIQLNIEGPYLERSISPTLRFDFTFFNRSQQDCYLSGMTYIFKIFDRSRSTEYFVGFLTFQEPMINIPTDGSTSVNALVKVDHYILKKIEELREGDVLNYKIEGNFLTIWYREQGIPVFDQSQKQSIQRKIAKSEWVETFLQRFEFKNVSLLEIPIIETKEFENVSKYLDSAWKAKFMGQYDKTLTDCRKTIEEVSTIIKKLGYETLNENGKKVPDWEKFFGSGEEIGEIFGIINQKVYGFTWPGAHTGKSINLEDADYALMITHAMANMVIKKSQLLENKS